jgi:hypothetical protein
MTLAENIENLKSKDAQSSALRQEIDSLKQRLTTSVATLTLTLHRPEVSGLDLSGGATVSVLHSSGVTPFGALVQLDVTDLAASLTVAVTPVGTSRVFKCALELREVYL